jgi:hypothetical protein
LTFLFFIFFQNNQERGHDPRKKKGGTIVGKDRRLGDGGRDTAGTVWRVV